MPSHGEKARALIELALDESTTDAERAQAAMSAVKLIGKHNLLAKPSAKNEAARVASEVFSKVTSPDFAQTLDATGRLVGTLADRLQALRDITSPAPRKGGKGRQYRR